jgi:hypothetical protein
MSDQDQEQENVDSTSEETSRPVDSDYPGAMSFKHSDTDFGVDGEKWSTAQSRQNHSELPLGTEAPKGKTKLASTHKTENLTGGPDTANHTSVRRSPEGSRRESHRVEGLDPRLGPQNGISRVSIEAAMHQIPTDENPLDFLKERGWILEDKGDIIYASEGGLIWMTALRALIKEYEKLEGHLGTDNIATTDDVRTREYKVGKMFEMASRGQTPSQFLESRGWRVVRHSSGLDFAMDDAGGRWITVEAALVAEYDKMERSGAIGRDDY